MNTREYTHSQPGKNPENQLDLIKDYREKVKQIEQEIDSMVQPLGHGTTSEHLQSILDSGGLGARLADNAFAKTKSATDLRKPDGLLSAYLFARLDKAQDLRITRQAAEGKNIISRYIEVNPNVTEESMKEKFLSYIDKRHPDGFPVVFIYDGGNELEYSYMNKRVPSEVEFQNTIANDRLKTLLVPENRIAEVSAMIKEKRLPARVAAIEALEFA